MGLGEVFSATWQDYKKNFKLVLKTFWWFNILPTIVLGIIFLVLFLLFLSSMPQLTAQTYANSTNPNIFSLTGNAIKDSADMNLPGYPAVFVIFMIIFAVIMAIFLILLYSTIYYFSLYNKKNMSFKEAARGGKRYFWKFLGLSILLSLFIFLFYVPGVLSILIDIGLWEFLNMALKIILVLLSVVLFILAFIFSLYYGISWIFSPYFLIGENRKITESMRFSRQMTKGRWWIVFGYLLLAWLIVAGISMVFSIPSFIISLFITFFSYLLLGAGSKAGYVILLVFSLVARHIFNLAAMIVSTPFIIFFFKNFYFELRKSKK